MKKYLGIDAGGSKLLVGVIGEDGKVVETARKDYADPYDKDTLLSDIVGLAATLHLENVAAGCITVPGLADSKSGIWVSAPFIKISNWNCAEELGCVFGVPFFAANDVNACAVGEKTFGVAKVLSDFMWITLSNGVGGALYLNDALYEGAHFGAGEIGHIVVEENGSKCCCGNIGCLETVASGRSLSDFYFARTGKRISAKNIGELAKQGDKGAIASFDRLGTGLGKVISYAANLLNIDTFVLGGGVATDMQIFAEKAKLEAEKRILHTANKQIKIEYTALGYNAALIGCAAVAISKEK